MPRLLALLVTALVAVAGLASSAQAHVIHTSFDTESLLSNPGDIVHDHATVAGKAGEGEQGTVTPGGFTSKDVEYLKYVPFEIGTATGARIVGKHLYVTSWRSFSIYDISDPENPVLQSTTPFGFQFENEDVATNGKILLFSEELGVNSATSTKLHVYDVRDKTSPKKLAVVPRAGDHTTECLFDCRWTYGSDGSIVDLADPANPKKSSVDWHKATGLTGGAHDVKEIKPGLVITSPINKPFQVLDVSDPLAPKVVATGAHPNTKWLFHSGDWPRAGEDKFILMQGERNARTRCDENTGPFMTYSAEDVSAGKVPKPIDTFRLGNGTYADGSPAINGLGCSAHWFDEHRTFKNGGLVTLGYYEHGARFLDVSKKGEITEKGWFLPHGGSTSATYWASDRVVYAIDYTRGFEILKWKGELPKR